MACIQSISRRKATYSGRRLWLWTSPHNNQRCVRLRHWSRCKKVRRQSLYHRNRWSCRRSHTSSSIHSMGISQKTTTQDPNRDRSRTFDRKMKCSFPPHRRLGRVHRRLQCYSNQVYMVGYPSLRIYWSVQCFRGRQSGDR